MRTREGLCCFFSSESPDFPYASDFKSWGFQKTSEYETSDEAAEAGSAGACWFDFTIPDCPSPSVPVMIKSQPLQQPQHLLILQDDIRKDLGYLFKKCRQGKVDAFRSCSPCSLVCRTDGVRVLWGWAWKAHLSGSK